MTTCLACEIESDIATEENPHPVHSRFHRCEKYRACSTCGQHATNGKCARCASVESRIESYLKHGGSKAKDAILSAVDRVCLESERVGPQKLINNCALANGYLESSCQMCISGCCPDRKRLTK